MNKFGHFVTEQVVKNKFANPDVSQNVSNNNLNFSEGSIHQLSNGWLKTISNCDGVNSTMKIYNNRNEVVYENSFPQLINLTFSPNNLHCVFYNLQNVYYLDLTTFKLKKVTGSNVFSINDSGDLAFYDEQKSTVNLNELSIKVNERIYKIFFFNNDVYIVTKKCIQKLSGNNLTPFFCVDEGRIFEAVVIIGNLYVSQKMERSGEFIFTSYHYNESRTFVKDGEHHFPIKGNYQISSPSINTPPSRNEPIRCPLNFYSDTVYQPVGNSYGEIQDYGSPPYLHPGVDFLGSHLQDVYSVKKGFVKAVLTTDITYHWRIAIADEDTPNQTIGYLYAHIDSTTIPYAVGDSVDEGAIIGQLVDFPVLGFVHCHFARITDQGAVWNGGWWTLDNPLKSMVNFYDTVPPEFQAIGLDAFAVQDATGNYILQDSVYGNIKVVSKFFDYINSTWRVDVDSIRFSLSSEIAPEILLIDTFSYQYNFYTDVYGGGVYYPDVINAIYARDSSCLSVGNYGTRDFFHIVTNSDGNDTIELPDAGQFLNTTLYPDGWYIFRTTAFDASGNSTTDSTYLHFQNGINGIKDAMQHEAFEIFPNPVNSDNFQIRFNGKNLSGAYIITDMHGKILISRPISGSNSRISIGDLPSGLYLIRFVNSEKTFTRKLIKL